MSLKARISKIEEKLPKEDMSFTELSYHTAKPTEEEREIAIKYEDGLDPPWEVMYVPYELRHELDSKKYNGRPVTVCDYEHGLYYNGETVIKMVNKWDKHHALSRYGKSIRVVYTINKIDHYDPDI